MCLSTGTSSRGRRIQLQTNSVVDEVLGGGGEFGVALDHLRVGRGWGVNGGEWGVNGKWRMGLGVGGVRVGVIEVWRGGRSPLTTCGWGVESVSARI